MRLTLRTLLAYRDHVLKPAELEDMHGRVQQSAMAANLLKRIEALVHRPTILAPPVEGKGLGADANSIAEYLDDALKRDKVPDLERICLESDVQLAELAQCHHLLSTALSTSVDVPPALRERILSFSNPAERNKALAARPTGLGGDSVATAARPAAASPAGAAPQSGDSSAVGDARAGRLVKAQAIEVPMVASGGDSIRPTGLDLEGSHLAHEVPEYLRGSTRDRWRGPLAIGALVAVLALLAWQSLGSWEMVREMFADRPIAATASQPADAPASGASAAQPDRSARPAEAGVTAPQPSPADAAGAVAAAGAGAGRPAIGPAPTSAVDASDSSAQPGSNAAATSPSPQPAFAHAAEWLPSDAQAMRAVILAYAGEGLPLHRMQAAERLPSGAHLVVPTASRPTLDLAQGPRWTFCGPTQMTVALPETGDEAVPRVDLRLGRALIAAGAQGRAVQIHTPDAQLLLTLSNAATRVALELSYAAAQHGPVSNRNAHPPVLQVYAIDGAVSISAQQAGGQQPGAQSGTTAPALALQAGQRIAVSGGAPSQPAAGEAPAWIDQSSDRPVDVLAAEDVQRQLSAEQGVGATLQSLVTNRRPETRSLAAQTLSMLGSWDWIAVEKNTLNDSRDRSYWTPLLDLTRQVIAANPEDAKQLRQVLTSRDPERGEFQADLWLGLTQAQLQNEGLSAMVDLLGSEALLDRILAIYQLQRLTGKDFGYQAGEVNRASVQQWKRELASGQLQLIPLSAASSN